MSQAVHAARMSPTPSSTRSPSRRITLHSAGVRLFAAYWGSLVLVDVTGQLLVLSLAALVMWTVACSIRQRPLVSVGAGAIAWCFFTGFVVNSEGDLTLHTPLDLLWLTVLTGSALAASGVAHLVRR